MLDFNSLMIFAKVAEASSFSEAARRLQMPVSTVSRRVSELEDQLGVQLLERSTRNLRLTEVGLELLDHAKRLVEVGEGVGAVMANQLSDVAGTLRLAAPPSISDSLVMPLVGAFQAAYPRVRFEIMITEQVVDFIRDRIDLEIHVGPVEDAALVINRLLRFRHQLVASPAYLGRVDPPQRPRDLLGHPIFAFSHFQPEYRWHFTHVNGRDAEPLSFVPHLGINDYAGVVTGLLAGNGIGDLPPIVQPDLMRDGRLVEVMPEWHLPLYDLVLMHPATRHTSRALRLFKEFSADRVATLFPSLPT